jgi:hypothetical protein
MGLLLHRPVRHAEAGAATDLSVYTLAILLDRNFCAIDVKGVHKECPPWFLITITFCIYTRITPHPELTGWYQHHIRIVGLRLWQGWAWMRGLCLSAGFPLSMPQFRLFHSLQHRGVCPGLA